MSGLWLPQDEDPRLTGAAGEDVDESDERAVLVDYLRHYRMTFELKCSGLDAEQLARRSVPPSTLSLLGLLRHLAKVEQIWFRIRLAGLEQPWHYAEPGSDADFAGAVADDAVVAEAWARWRFEVGFAEHVVRRANSMEVRTADGTGNLRGILVHMVEEYARHCGHADLLRECIDGRTGQ